MQWSITTTSLQETHELGMAIASVLRLGDIIALSGSLGAGKTSLVHGIGMGLGIQEAMPSPTFAIMRAYPIQPSGELLHLDAYRLQQLDTDHGMEDHANNTSIMAVEWPEHVPLLFQQATLFIQIHKVGVEQRAFTIQSNDVRFERIFAHYGVAHS
jgi:tRNA threonylcarbamoyladenosine biosynthesis protein TsaE